MNLAATVVVRGGLVNSYESPGILNLEEMDVDATHEDDEVWF